MLKEIRLTPDLPPVWLAGFALLAWALARAVPLLRFEAGTLGAAAIALGLVLVAWAGGWFWRKDTPIEPGTTPSALIVEGPYRRVNRNPIYTGLALILLGWALRLGAVSAVLPALVYPVVLHRRFVLPEEAALRQAFGEKAEAYLAATRRW